MSRCAPARRSASRCAAAPRDIDLIAAPERRVVSNPMTGSSAKLGVLGIGGSTAASDSFHKQYNPVEAVQGGVSKSWEQIETTVFYISRIFRGRESGDQLGSFIGIAKVSGEFAHAGAHGAPNFGAKVGGRQPRADDPDRRAFGKHRFRQPFTFAGAGRRAPAVLRL